MSERGERQSLLPLKGGIGADTLTGNTGADIFYYGKENITRNLEADVDNSNIDAIPCFRKGHYKRRYNTLF